MNCRRLSLLRIQYLLQICDLEGADCELTVLLWRFLITVRRLQGCLPELRAWDVAGPQEVPKNHELLKFDHFVFCSSPCVSFIIHLSLDQPPLLQGPMWWRGHCAHAALKYKYYLFGHLKSAALSLTPTPNCSVCAWYLLLAESFWKLSYNMRKISQNAVGPLYCRAVILS